MLWFDLDNSPHVPLFRPIFRELDRRMEQYFITAREFAQTRELLELWQIDHTIVGTHGGKSTLKKIVNLLHRSRQLASHMLAKRATLAVSHGSRAQVLASWRLGIPSVLMLDYEFTESRIFNTFATHLLMPSLIPRKRLAEAGFNLQKVIRYDGFKEEVYLQDFVPQADFRRRLDVDEQTILVTIRPPSVVGNYHDRRSEELFQLCLDYAASDGNTICLIVNRGRAEEVLVPQHLRTRRNVRFLQKPVDGLQLLWHSDVVISGGGTMNREASLLGVPVYSIFTGRRPYLDESLAEQGRLRFIDGAEQVKTIPLVWRAKSQYSASTNHNLAREIADIIIDLSKEIQIS